MPGSSELGEGGPEDLRFFLNQEEKVGALE